MSRVIKYLTVAMAASAVGLLACAEPPTAAPVDDEASLGQAPLTYVSFTGTCGSELNTLHTATADATFRNSRDQTGLLNKVAEAADKLREDKIADAYQKMLDYDAKLGALEATVGTNKEKIGAADAAALRTALDAVLTCLAP